MEEAQALFAALSTAWDANDEAAVSSHLISPMTELAEFAEDFGRPVALEALFPIDERRALLVTRSSQGGLVAYELIRGRDRRLRLEMGAMIGDRRDASATIDGFAAEAARMVEPPREKRPRKKKSRRPAWRPAPESFPSIGEIPYLGLDRPTASAEAIASLASAVGVPLPEGYVTYVTRFGESCDSTFLRVYPPERVLRERDEWQIRIDTYWHWSAAEDGFDRDEAYESYVLADTLSGDELIWHPAKPGRFYVLPRNLDAVIAREMSFEKLLAWAASSGDLGARVAFRFVAPLRDRARVDFECDDVDVDAVVSALTSLGDGVTSAKNEEGAHVIWTTHGVEVFASEDPYLGLAHEPSTDPAFVARVVGALEGCGFARA